MRTIDSDFSRCRGDLHRRRRPPAGKRDINDANAWELYDQNSADAEEAYQQAVATATRDHNVALAQAERDLTVNGDQAAYDSAVATADDQFVTAIRSSRIIQIAQIIAQFCVKKSHLCAIHAKGRMP